MVSVSLPIRYSFPVQRTCKKQEFIVKNRSNCCKIHALLIGVFVLFYCSSVDFVFVAY